MSELVSFDNPPLVEVACGITFGKLRLFSVPHFGVVWNVFRDEFPAAKSVLPLLGPDAEFILAGEEAIHRVWLLNRTQTEVIQVQQDRFITNWRRMSPADQYPRFSYVADKFRERLEKFKAVVKELEAGEVTPTRASLSYTNVIPCGQGWDTLEHIGNIFPDFPWRKRAIGPLQTPMSFHWKGSFSLSDNLGNLSIALNSGKPRNGKTSVFSLQLEAENGLAAGVDIFVWFESVRHQLNQAFVDITKDAIQHGIWKRKD